MVRHEGLGGLDMNGKKVGVIDLGGSSLRGWVYPEVDSSVTIICVDYRPDRAEIRKIDQVEGFLAAHRPEWSQVRWVNIAGDYSPELIESFAAKYQLHPLAVEDVLDRQQRPKVEDYPASKEGPGRLFIVTRLLHLVDGVLKNDQMSLFLGSHTLLTFQSHSNGVFDSVYRRIEVDHSRIRSNDPSFLCYTLLDAVVDGYFPVLEYYSDCIDDIEEELLSNPRQSVILRGQTVKRGLLSLRRVIWPTRELIVQLQRDRHECLSETSLTYFRDVYDHCVQILDLSETCHEIATSLTETYMSIVSNRMNEIVKVLTVISTIFIPLTFVAGVYGMNMPIPENDWEWSYPIFWLVCLSIAGGMLAWFRRLGWI